MNDNVKLQKRIGKQVKKAREKKGWSIPELAHAVDVSSDIIVHIEDGTQPFNIDTCLRIAFALETELVYP